MTLTESYRQLASLRQQLEEHEKSAAARSQGLRTEIATLQTTVNQVQAGLDPDLIEVAGKVLSVHGSWARAGADRASARQSAIDALVAGGTFLRATYVGTKNYAEWSGQRSDHSYGMGPKHGTIVFSIGLRADVRRREPFHLTDAEIEASIYFLTHIEAIQNASVSKVA